MKLRANAPVLDGYLSYLESEATPFITPGHKGRASKLDADLGSCYASDVPLYGGIDTVKLARGLVAEAEQAFRRLVRRRLVPLLDGGLDPLQPGPVPRHRPARRQGRRDPLAAPVPPPRHGAGRPGAVLAADDDRHRHGHAAGSGSRRRRVHARGQSRRPRRAHHRAGLSRHALRRRGHHRSRPQPGRARDRGPGVGSTFRPPSRRCRPMPWRSGPMRW